MDISKYYTPTLGEFHIGFEYEIKEGKYWQPAMCSGIPVGHKTLEDYIRVKYLDQEDIESLGFIRDCERAGYKFFLEFENKDRLLLENLSLTTNMSDMFQIKLWHKEKGLYGKNTYYGDTLFIGIIKNKSELKKLIKQVNIHD